MAADTGRASSFAASPFARTGYRWSILAILALTYAVHSMDRAMPGILVEPVRHEFHLKDAALGLFTGSGFGVGFALAVLPIGYLTDRVNRRNLLAAVLVLWSACTALGGLSRSYLQLILTRVAVGTGEAGASPIILPLLTDIFPAGRRAIAMGVLYAGVPLGALLAASLGGFIAAGHGWRAALLLAGTPGLVLAVLVMVVVKDPGRGAVDEAPPEATPRLREVAAFLVKEPAVICVILAGVLIGLVSITLAAWASSFFIRVHGVSLRNVGLVVGLGGGACGVAAPPLFGWLADLGGRRGQVWPLTLAWVAGVGWVGAGLVWLFTPILPLAFAGYILGDFLRAGYPPLLYPVVLTRTPARMRGAVMSVVQFLTNLMGFGVGPLLAGVLSDIYGGGKSLRYAMADVLGIYAAIAALLIAASWMLRAEHRRSGGAAAAPV
jgi:MFS family permease